MYYWNEIPYRALRKGVRRKELRPKVVTTLFAIVVAVRRARVPFSISLSLIESKPVILRKELRLLTHLKFLLHLDKHRSHVV